MCHNILLPKTNLRSGILMSRQGKVSQSFKLFIAALPVLRKCSKVDFFYRNDYYIFFYNFPSFSISTPPPVWGYGWGYFYPKRVIQIGGVELSIQISHINIFRSSFFHLVLWIWSMGQLVNPWIKPTQLFG